MNIVNRYNCKHNKIKSKQFESKGKLYRRLNCINCHKTIEIISEEEYNAIFEPKTKGGLVNEVI